MKINYKKFIEENFRIIDKETLIPVPFKFNDMQTMYYNMMVEQNPTLQGSREIILKARQLGCSSFVLALFAVDFLLRPYSVSICISHRKDATDILFKKVKAYINSYFAVLAEQTGQSVDKISKSFLKSDNKNYLENAQNNAVFYLGTAGARVGGRGGSGNNILFSECAFYQDTDIITAQEIVLGTAQQVPQNQGMIFIESCVSGDTLVDTNNGLCRIDSLFPKNINDRTYIDNQLSIWGRYKFKESSQLFYNGVSDNFKIITQNGYSLTASSIHPILSISKDGPYWKKAKEFKVGDYVAIQTLSDNFGNFDLQNFTSKSRKGTRYSIDKFNPKNINSDDIAYFLGLFLAEGYCRSVKSGSYVVITSGDEYIHDNLENWTGVKWVRNDIHHSRCTKKSLVEYLKFLGFDISKKARYKTIPDFVLSLSKSNLSNFISGMFDGDGSAHGKRGTTSYVSTSKELMDRLQILLLKFGIYSSVYYHPPHYGGIIRGERIKGGDSYEMSINGQNSKIFYTKIGFRLKRKQEKSKFLINKQSKSELIPFISSGILRQYLKDNNTSYAQLKKRYGLNLSYLYEGKKVGQSVLIKILDIVGKNNELLNELAFNNYKWIKIKDIQRVTCPTYDFVIPDGHSFNSNGLISHNTPNGAQGFFYDEWQRTQEFDLEGKRNSSYTPRFFAAQDFYTEEWLENKKKDFPNEQMFLQEYGRDSETCFLASGTPYFDNQILKVMLDAKVQPIAQGRFAPDGSLI